MMTLPPPVGSKYMRTRNAENLGCGYIKKHSVERLCELVVYF